MDSAVNPYQPPTVESTRMGAQPIDEFSFVLTKRNLRHGQSHHLIRCRPRPVILISVLMVTISVVVFSYAVLLVGPRSALWIMPVLMALSAIAYLSVIKEPQKHTEKRMAECGLVAGATVFVHADAYDVIARTNKETVKWSRDHIKRYRTPRGIMIVPEEFVFLFLPSRGQFDRKTYQSIQQMFPVGHM